ncbi:MAG: DNA repair protein RecO [Erysipelotrichaceae bacterium]
MSDQIVHGFVIKLHDYRDNDQIISVYTKELGLLNFITKSSKKVTSKNSLASMQYACVKIRFSYVENRTLFSLRQREVIQFFPKLYDDLELQTLAECALETIYHSHFEDSEQIFAMLLWLFEQLQAQLYPYTALGLVLAHVFQLQGCAPVVDECIQCGATKNISSIQVIQGGLGCLACFPSNATRQQCHEFRMINKGSMRDIEAIGNISMPTLMHQLAFARVHLSIALHSLTFLEQLHRLAIVSP